MTRRSPSDPRNAIPAKVVRRHPAHPRHVGDGSDVLGRALELTITISSDGTLLFGDLTADLLPVAAALCPGDPTLQRRLEIADALNLRIAEEKYR